MTALLVSACIAWSAVVFTLLAYWVARGEINRLEVRNERLQTGNAALCDQVAWQQNELDIRATIIERHTFGPLAAWHMPEVGRKRSRN